jgi:hypothetical protein
MAQDSTVSIRFPADPIGNTVLGVFAFAAVLLAVVPAAAQDPVALIETLTSPTQRVEMMSYARRGEIIRLGPDQTLVLSYGDSCVREIITGGTVMIGREQSEVRFGEVKRTKGQCATGKFDLTGIENVAGGSRAFRGVH